MGAAWVTRCYFCMFTFTAYPIIEIDSRWEKHFVIRAESPWTSPLFTGRYLFQFAGKLKHSELQHYLYLGKYEPRGFVRLIFAALFRQAFENKNSFTLFWDWLVQLYCNVQIINALICKWKGSCEQEKIWQNNWIVTDSNKNVHFVYRLFDMIEQWKRLSFLSQIFVNSSLGNPKVGYSIQQREMNRGAKSMTFSSRLRICTTRWNGKRKLEVSTVIFKKIVSLC